MASDIEQYLLILRNQNIDITNSLLNLTGQVQIFQDQLTQLQVTVTTLQQAINPTASTLG